MENRRCAATHKRVGWVYGNPSHSCIVTPCALVTWDLNDENTGLAMGRIGSIIANFTLAHWMTRDCRRATWGTRQRGDDVYELSAYLRACMVSGASALYRYSRGLLKFMAYCGTRMADPAELAIICELVKRHAWLIVRFLVTAALLVWLFRDKTLHAQLAGLPMPANAGWLMVAWLAAGLGEVSGLLRFWCCLHLAGVPLPLHRAAALHFGGSFSSLFLPGMAGGDALKIALLTVYFPQRKWAGALAVLMDRLSGFVVITLWAGLMAWRRADWFAQSTIAATALKAVLFTAGPMAASLIVWFLLSRTPLMRTRLRRFPFRERILRCEAVFDALVADPSRTLVVLLASIAGFGAYFTIFQCTALAYDAPLIWRDTWSVMPLLDLIITLPVTVAGVGLREQAFRAILAPLCGLTPAQGVIVSLAGFLVASTWSLLGAPLFLWLRLTLQTATRHP